MNTSLKSTYELLCSIRNPGQRDLCNFLSSRWFINRLAKWSNLEIIIEIVIDSLLSNLDVCIVDFKPKASAIMEHGSDKGRANAHKWIKHCIPTIGKCQDTALHEFNGKLTRVDGFFRMIGFDVWDIPQLTLPIFGENRPEIGRILAEWITRGQAALFAFIVQLPRIFRRDADTIEIKRVVIGLGKP